jgi:hypothetical protein
MIGDEHDPQGKDLLQLHNVVGTSYVKNHLQKGSRGFRSLCPHLARIQPNGALRSSWFVPKEKF